MTAASDFDYRLPPELIAQEPAERRDASRAQFLTRGQKHGTTAPFHELADHLRGDECLVVNDTRVIPARIRAERATGGRVEVFLLRPNTGGEWDAWVSPGRRVRPGERLRVRGEERITLGERQGSFWRVRLDGGTRPEDVGEVPLPPYIERRRGDPRLRGLDAERYQTVFAQRAGAVAAPTAGLHFSPGLLARLSDRGIPVVSVTLHVGPGTFQPIACERVEDHRVDPEPFEVGSGAREQLAAARQSGRRIVAVGTTTLRVLESLDTLGPGPDLRSETSLTILPGHRFRHVQGLITNYHLPRSSLLVLVCAFHGRDATLAAYRRAVDERLRFYSYGDAMVILPESPA